jgi:hypothetical protein
MTSVAGLCHSDRGRRSVALQANGFGPFRVAPFPGDVGRGYPVGPLQGSRDDHVGVHL